MKPVSESVQKIGDNLLEGTKTEHYIMSHFMKTVSESVQKIRMVPRWNITLCLDSQSQSLCKTQKVPRWNITLHLRYTSHHFCNSTEKRDGTKMEHYNICIDSQSQAWKDYSEQLTRIFEVLVKKCPDFSMNF